MLLVLDESKKLGEGKIVIGGYLSSHSKSYIDTFITNKKSDFCIQENRELKSSNMFGKQFLQHIETDTDFEQLDIHTFGYVFKNYFRDNEKEYGNFLEAILMKIVRDKKITRLHIVHDKLSLKNKKQFITKIKDFLFQHKCKVKIEILDSQKRLYLQLADLIVSKYKELYLFEDVFCLPDFIQKKDIREHKKT